MFVDSTVDKITLTYNYISKDEALKLCYKHIENYGAKELLIDYFQHYFQLKYLNHPS